MGNNCKNEAVVKYKAHLTDDATSFVVPDVKRGVIGFLRYAGIDQHALVKMWTNPSGCLPFATLVNFRFNGLTTMPLGRLVD